MCLIILFCTSDQWTVCNCSENAPQGAEVIPGWCLPFLPTNKSICNYSEYTLEKCDDFLQKTLFNVHRICIDHNINRRLRRGDTFHAALDMLLNDIALHIITVIGASGRVTSQSYGDSAQTTYTVCPLCV